MDREEAIFDNEPYHLYNRGNNKQKIFRGASDYDTFVRRLDSYALRYRIDLVAYSLMPNHYHIAALQRPGGSIPAMMDALGTSVTKRFNLKYAHLGHLFQGPYQYVLIAPGARIADVAAYIHLNPVRARLVRNPEDWQWSSFRFLVEDVLPPSLIPGEGNLHSTQRTVPKPPPRG